MGSRANVDMVVKKKKKSLSCSYQESNSSHPAHGLVTTLTIPVLN